MKYKTILITGGAGFVGSNLAISFKNKYPQLDIIAFDNLKRRGSELNISRLKQNAIEFIHGDIRNPEDLEIKGKVDLLIECSAEPSVLAGFNESPKYVIDTNLVGTINCLELARKNMADVVFLSTSRVYPYEPINQLKLKEEKTRFSWSAQKGKVQGWSKNGIDVDFSLEGVRSMYGATKLCSEYILQEYINMYGIKGVINRCGVIAGPWQFGKVDQGVFTLWMLAHYFKRNLKYIGFGGKGKQVRDLMHIDDIFDLIDLEVNGQIFNAGGGYDISLSLLETTGICEKMTGNRIKIDSDKKTRPADLGIYITDNQKVTKTLGWKPKKYAEEILEDIYLWIQENEALIKNIL
jgi:CDP-paratose 2-epimerase